MTITIPDYKILKSLLDSVQWPADERASSLRRFEARLDASTRLNPEEVPANVVTMHSIILIRELSRGVRYSFTLVFPWEADPGHHRLSVLSQAGMALLGRPEGDVVVCGHGQRLVSLRIEEIFFQPEDSLRVRRSGGGRLSASQGPARAWK